MTKQEKIQEAYGKYWESIKDLTDENGFIMMAISITRDVKLDFERKVMYHSKNTSGVMGMCVRPKSLQGIETNNGWIKIESEEDLPEFFGSDYWVIMNKKIVMFNRNLNNQEYWNNHITHYQPIVKPEPPIY